MQVTRRGLLIGTLAGGGLAIGYALRPRRYGLPLPAGKDEIAFGAWIKLSRDGVVTVAVPQLEMGQGITTVIPQIVAVELGADWKLIAVEAPPPSGLYANYPLAARWSGLWMPAFEELGSVSTSPVARNWAESTRFNATVTKVQDGLEDLFWAGHDLALNEKPDGNPAETSNPNSAAPSWSYGQRTDLISSGLNLYAAASHRNTFTGTATDDAIEGYVDASGVGANTGTTPIAYNYGFGPKEVNNLISSVNADGLFIHLNHTQEAVQPEGDTNFENLYEGLRKLLPHIKN